MNLLRKIWPKKDLHGKNLGKKFRNVKLANQEQRETLQKKYVCPVCKKGWLDIKECGTKGTCTLCGQSFLCT